jgi:hypothetical protein
MKNIFLVLAIFFVYLNSFSQTISGTVHIQEAPHLKSCAQVYINYNDYKKDTVLFTNKDGRFKLQNVEDGKYSISIYQTKYRLAKTIRDTIFKDDVHYDLELVTYDQIRDSTEDFAKANIVDLGLSVIPIAIPLEDYDQNYKGVFSAGINFSFKMKLAKRMQLGFNYSPINLSYYFIDKSKFKLENTDIKSIRYHYSSTSIFVFNRFFLLKNNNADLGFYIDFGVGYQVPYMFTYNTYYPNSKKVSIGNIHHFNDFQLMLKLGYQYLNIKANYRLTDNMLKEGYLELPRFTIGVEVSLPTVTATF